MTDKLAWGAHVSSAFRTRVRAIGANLGIDPNNLMACMAWESGETFSSSVANMAGSGAVGLIQFMPATAAAMGTTTAKLAALTPVQQLDWVERYFRPYGRLKTLADVYMAILWPAAIGKPMDAVLWSKAVKPTTYRQNAGLDANRDGIITKIECAGKVYAKLEKGLLPEHAA
ncbi:transglycosylase SLT domain-containing protein [Sphingomonas sp. NFR15]|uniref:transglycosylase SLT domain-containing protein n=1 Tax=Sphingomonas sp. NFR15 TaxID=1566282 RepID=UPI00088A1106|nr:transglycosylase SLT domain-containing protein [Sphingomonas sp. NFR15]SDA14861.1 Transglycosylase SLT domain-containing protein [Sphingomonas sp. NFR15]